MEKACKILLVFFEWLYRIWDEIQKKEAKNFALINLGKVENEIINGGNYKKRTDLQGVVRFIQKNPLFQSDKKIQDRIYRIATLQGGEVLKGVGLISRLRARFFVKFLLAKQENLDVPSLIVKY